MNERTIHRQRSHKQSEKKVKEEECEGEKKIEK